MKEGADGCDEDVVRLDERAKRRVVRRINLDDVEAAALSRKRRKSVPIAAGKHRSNLSTDQRVKRSVARTLGRWTMTLVVLGVLGVWLSLGAYTLEPGEAAILCMGQVRPMPWVVDGELAVRQVMQLTLSFDHRLVDGDLGSRTLADVAAVLERPEQALVWG